MRALAAAAVLLAACLNLARDFPATNPRGLCGNGAHDGQESDVDCGGPCGPCVAGESCSASSDCETEICDAGVCAPTRCDDGLRGSTETDVDCGGECAPCGLGRRCGTANDCAFARCIGNKCEALTQSLENTMVPGRLGRNVALFGSTIAALAAPLVTDPPFTAEIVVWTRGASSFAEHARIPSAAPAALAMIDDALFVGVPAGTGRVDLFDEPVALASTSMPAIALAPNDTTTGFGTALAAARTVLAVASFDRVYVFSRASSGWPQQHSASVPGILAIAITTTTLVAAAPGAVRIFTRQGTTWSEQQTLSVAPSCGASVALLDDDLLVGCTGSALRFLRSGAKWSLAQTFGAAVGASAGAQIVALGAGVAMIGDPEAAKVWPYYRVNSAEEWLSSPPFEGPLGSWFGFSIAGTDRLLTVGAPTDNPIGGGSTRGEVYVFGAP